MAQLVRAEDSLSAACVHQFCTRYECSYIRVPVPQALLCSWSSMQLCTIGTDCKLPGTCHARLSSSQDWSQATCAQARAQLHHVISWLQKEPSLRSASKGKVQAWALSCRWVLAQVEQEERRVIRILEHERSLGFAREDKIQAWVVCGAAVGHAMRETTNGTWRAQMVGTLAGSHLSATPSAAGQSCW